MAAVKPTPNELGKGATAVRLFHSLRYPTLEKTPDQGRRGPAEETDGSAMQTRQNADGGHSKQVLWSLQQAHQIIERLLQFAGSLFLLDHLRHSCSFSASVCFSTSTSSLGSIFARFRSRHHLRLQGWGCLADDHCRQLHPLSRFWLVSFRFHCLFLVGLFHPWA